MHRTIPYRCGSLAVSLALLLNPVSSAVAQHPLPPLRAVCIGVSQHRVPSLNRGVQYAAKDARDVAQLLRSQEGRSFGQVECQVLINDEATRDNVERALVWLRNRAEPTAYLLVYLAGHGGPDDLGHFAFTLHDTHPLLGSTLLPGRILRDGLQGLPGKIFLVLDTCHAGSFAGAGTSFVTLAGCMAQEFSSEKTDLQNGYFTRAFVEGLTGLADANRDAVVTLAELDAYIADRVQSLSGGRQQSTMHRPASIPSRLPLARLTMQTVTAPPAIFRESMSHLANSSP